MFMLILRYATILLTSPLSLLPGCTPQARGWQDPSPRRTMFVVVQPDVRLEVLDWGGSGRSVILLAGSGLGDPGDFPRVIPRTSR